MNDQKKSFHKVGLISINLVYILALMAVIFPLLLVGKYNFPSADDWSYGKYAYKALAEGGGLIDVLKCSFEVVAKHYMDWEGRFSNAFLASLQPGIWGEQYYCVVPWMMLGGMIVGELVLAWSLLGAGHKDNKWLVIPIIIPSLLMQILYTPSIVESFYWYTGAVNYTFVFGLSMFLYASFIKIGTGDAKGWKLAVQALMTSLLAVLIGGDNFSTSLSTFLGMAVLSGVFAVFYRRGLRRTWYLTLLTGGSLVTCILAPGNTSRLEGNFGGSTTGNAFEAIWQSLVRTFTNMYSWTNVKVLLVILLIVPFAWMAVKNIKYDFRFPALFTLLTFGIYASQITATLYVDGTTGGGRMAAILYYFYHVWVVGNVCYWIGWIRRVSGTWSPEAMKRLGVVCRVGRKAILPYCAVLGLILCGIIYCCNLKEISSYRAYRDWRQGWAAQYAREWEERLVILKDPAITKVEFAPISVYPESYMYTDLQDEDGYVWVNKACASYYGKESIIVVDSANNE